MNSQTNGALFKTRNILIQLHYLSSYNWEQVEKFWLYKGTLLCKLSRMWLLLQWHKEWSERLALESDAINFKGLSSPSTPWITQYSFLHFNIGPTLQNFNRPHEKKRALLLLLKFKQPANFRLKKLNIWIGLHFIILNYIFIYF